MVYCGIENLKSNCNFLLLFITSIKLSQGMHLLWDAQRQAGTGYAHAGHMYSLFTLRQKLINCHEDYLHYTEFTSALDYKWTGIMDMQTLLFLIEDAVTGCKFIV